MKRFLSIIFIFLLSFGLFGLDDTASHAITIQINEIVLIGLNNTSSLVLTTNNPTNPGEDVAGDTNASKLLQYTSIVASGTTRNITVKWGATEQAPAGTSLKIEATSIPANCGTTAGEITISDTAQAIVTGVGSCATGIGANGTEVTYTFGIDNKLLLEIGDNQTVNITFTITDAS